MCKYEIDIPEYVELVEAVEELLSAWHNPSKGIILYDEMMKLQEALKKIKE